VDGLSVDTEVHHTWDEAVERTIDAQMQLGELFDSPRTVIFEFPSSSEIVDLRNSVGKLVGRIRKTQWAIAGRIQLSVERLHRADLSRLTVEVVNATPYGPANAREAALPSSFASAHTILGVRDGEFISLLDPPEDLREAAAGCQNVGVYPVLVGEPGEHDVLLSSPIILYDYPQIAPESAGDFFDATEMDEMLTLRVMTLTDAEKNEMRNSDNRVRELLERTEATAREQLSRTHGVVHSLHPIKDDLA
jgi:hydrogenase maturation protease